MTFDILQVYVREVRQSFRFQGGRRKSHRRQKHLSVTKLHLLNTSRILLQAKETATSLLEPQHNVGSAREGTNYEAAESLVSSLLHFTLNNDWVTNMVEVRIMVRAVAVEVSFRVL